MHTRTAFLLLASLGCLASIGCGSSSSSGEATGAQRASLHRAKSCGDLLTDLKTDATVKLNRGIDRQIELVQKCIQKNGDAQCAGYGGYYGEASFGADDATSGALPPAAPEASGGAASSNERATSYSETNTQVKGVDEADIVKNDGKNLYVLHGRAFKILNAWPASALSEVASIDIEGTPSEMFVADGKAVVYSQVNGAEIFQAAGVQPKQQYQDNVYYGGGGGAVRAPVDVGGDSSANAGPYVPLTKITVLTLTGATPAVTSEVYFEGGYLSARRVASHVRTVLQGYAHGPKLKYGIYELYASPETTVNDGTGDVRAGGGAGSAPANPYPQTGTATITALEQLRSENLAAINASVLDDWLPYTFVKNGAAVTAHTVACEDFYVPTAGSTESGLTEVAAIGLANPGAAPKETAILGRVDTVYGSADTLYLAAHAWSEPPLAWMEGDVPVSGGGGDVAVPPPTTAEPAPAPSPGNLGTKSVRPLADPSQVTSAIIPYSTTMTHVHKLEFATDPTFPNYVASGTVLGSVKNQFSLDDKDGFLRIATTENLTYTTSDGQWVSPTPTDNSVTNPPPPERPSNQNRVFVLAQNGPWLDIVGDVGALAPNEQIYGVRFVGTRGYVVTFRRVDPLFVVDLAAPQSPTVLAALKIPGFSEYMHPLDENHLLTIGRDADADGRTQGLALQIFDVTDGSNPVLVHKRAYSSQEYGQSEAEYDHKAFTYFADKGLLAFPYYAYNASTPDGMRSSLELFKVDVAAGFTKVGSIDHTSLVSTSPQGFCGGYYGPSVRRGVFMENVVYSISYGGVIAKDTTNMSGAGSSLALPAPQANPGYGPDVCY